MPLGKGHASTRALSLLLLYMRVTYAKLWEQFWGDLAQSCCQRRRREALQGVAATGIIAHPQLVARGATDAEVSPCNPEWGVWN